MLSILVACEKTYVDVDPSYRIFIDDVLLVERVFWPTVPLHWIEERLTFEDDDQMHCGRIETVDSDAGTVGIVSLQCLDGDNGKPLQKQNAWVDVAEPGKFTFSLNQH